MSTTGTVLTAHLTQLDLSLQATRVGNNVVITVTLKPSGYARQFPNTKVPVDVTIMRIAHVGRIDQPGGPKFIFNIETKHFDDQRLSTWGGSMEQTLAIPPLAGGVEHRVCISVQPSGGRVEETTQNNYVTIPL